MLLEANETRVCFRCEGLAVVDKSVLHGLPAALNMASEHILQSLPKILDDDAYKAYNLAGTLRRFAIMLEAVPD